MAGPFSTVPDDLRPIADCCEEHIRALGYSVAVERSEDYFPEAATIYAKLRREHRVFLFDKNAKEARLSLWAGYGRSCNHSIFVTFCLPATGDVPGAMLMKFRQLGVGLALISEEGEFAELVEPIDLSMNVALPPLTRHTRTTVTELRKVHARFERDWKRGFEDACKLVEKSARRQLTREAAAGRLQVRGKGGVARMLGAPQVGRMPLGALADVFCQKLTPSHVDALLCSGLKRINPDRIKVAHDKLPPRADRALRAIVGRHMWTIDNMLIALR